MAENSKVMRLLGQIAVIVLCAAGLACVCAFVWALVAALVRLVKEL